MSKVGLNLLGFQSEDGEDGSAVHPPHARAVTHVAEQDGGHLRARLR